MFIYRGRKDGLFLVENTDNGTITRLTTQGVQEVLAVVGTIDGIYLDSDGNVVETSPALDYRIRANTQVQSMRGNVAVRRKATKKRKSTKKGWAIVAVLLFFIVVGIFGDHKDDSKNSSGSNRGSSIQSEGYNTSVQNTSPVVEKDVAYVETDFDTSSYSPYYADVVYECAEDLMGQRVLTSVVVKSAYNKYINAKTPDAIGSLEFNFDSKLDDIKDGVSLTIAGVVSYAGSKVKLDHCHIVGLGEIDGDLRVMADSQRRQIKASVEENLKQLVNTSFDTSDYVKMCADILYEYGDLMTGMRVLTVITVEGSSDKLLNSSTTNNDSFFYSVNCKFDSSSDIHGVKDGDKLTVAGVVDEPSIIGDTTTLLHCTIVGLGEVESELIDGMDEQRKYGESLVAQKEADDKAAAAQSKSEYIAQCSTVSYNDVARNPDNYDGKKIKFSGKVIQESEGWFNSLTLRVDSGNDSVWYVSYTMSDGESRILEGDRITVYGKCTGVTSYKTIFGQTITIPSVKMEYYTVG